MDEKRPRTGLYYELPPNLFLKERPAYATPEDIDEAVTKLKAEIRNERQSYSDVMSKPKITSIQILTPKNVFLLSKFQKMRIIILILSTFVTGMMVSLILTNYGNETYSLFYLTIGVPAFGTMVTAFWVLMKRKKWDHGAI